MAAPKNCSMNRNACADATTIVSVQTASAFAMFAEWSGSMWWITR